MRHSLPSGYTSNRKMLAITLLAGLTAACLLVAAVWPRVVDPTSFFFADDTNGQRIAHKLFLLGVLACGLIPWHILFKAGTRKLDAAGQPCPHTYTVLLGLLSLVFLFGYRSVGRDVYLVGILLAAGCGIFCHRMAHTGFLVRTLPKLLLGLACAVYLGVGLFVPVKLSAGFLAGGELHFTAFLADAYRLAAHAEISRVLPFQYGYLFQSLLAAWLQKVGPITLGQQIRALQGVQILAALCVLAAYAAWKPRRPWQVLLAFLLVLPWMHLEHVNVLGSPTSSAARYMGFALGLLVLVKAGKIPDRLVAPAFGALAGLCMLINLETGICLSLGLLGYLFIAAPLFAWKAYLKSLCLFLLGGAPVFALFALCFKLAFGLWPLYPVWNNILRFSSGFGGLALSHSFNWLFLVISLQCALCLVLTCWGRRELPPSPRRRVQFSVAIIALAWMAAYANRSSPNKLWPALLFANLFFMEYFALLPLARRFSPRRLPLKIVVAVLVLAPYISYHGLNAAMETMRKARHQPSDIVVSGALFPEKVGRSLQTQADYLRDPENQKGTMYLTTSSFSLPLMTGFYPPVSFQDILVDGCTKELFQERIQEIKDGRFQRVLFDPAESSGSAFLDGFLDQARQGLSDMYEYSGTKSGWDIWVRRQ